MISGALWVLVAYVIPGVIGYLIALVDLGHSVANSDTLDEFIERMLGNVYVISGLCVVTNLLFGQYLSVLTSVGTAYAVSLLLVSDYEELYRDVKSQL